MAKEHWPDWNVYIRDRASCVYCGLDGTADIRLWRQLQIDHVVPREAGGDDTRDNKVVSCVRCNVLKGRKDPRARIGTGNDPDRSNLIQAARDIISEAQTQAKESADYALMMEEIRATH
jgi:5-methylcytosine-specific restriction endonuclease McrA